MYCLYSQGKFQVRTLLDRFQSTHIQSDTCNAHIKNKEGKNKIKQNKSFPI